nr:F-box protein At5g49610-like [Ipomoea batatas]
MADFSILDATKLSIDLKLLIQAKHSGVLCLHLGDLSVVWHIEKVVVHHLLLAKVTLRSIQLIKSVFMEYIISLLSQGVGKELQTALLASVTSNRPPNKNNYICEIFDSKIWSWRQTENLITERSTIFDHQSPVCTGGLVYWLTNRNTILAFDSATETHLEFAGPLAATEENRSYMYERIVEYKGRLGFICKYKSDELVLWGLEDRTNYRWEIKRVVGIDKEKNRLIGCNLADMALMLGYRDQVYAQSGFYNPRDIFPFQSNSEPVDLEDGCMLSCLEEMMNDC